ncbi:MAG: hypothetical protein EXR99_02590 [Gemmataceae bacterium]|nr:hypothetical protein [Gemmataceae bacterium]
MKSAIFPLEITGQALDWLRRSGNPFRNYFARNSDDEVCAIYHVPELFSREREQLLRVVDQYRYHPTTHSEVVPVLGNKGAGKTHLLHSIKHANAGNWQLLVTPGSYQRDTDFLEYLLFQVLDKLLGGAKQGSWRPKDYAGEQLMRLYLGRALGELQPEQGLELFPSQGLGWLSRAFGLGAAQAVERTNWLVDELGRTGKEGGNPGRVLRLCEEAGLSLGKAHKLMCDFLDKVTGHDAASMMRHAILRGFSRAVFLQDDGELAGFLTYGFAELDFKVRPGRQDLVLALFKAVMSIFQELRIPVVIAFDQLEDLLLARRNEETHKTAETFFAGIVKVMHQLDGISFLIFAERGLWNRFIPSLDGYIQDRLNNPVHVPGYGTINALKLESPPRELVAKVVVARLEPALRNFPGQDQLPGLFPFTLEQVEKISLTEPTLRDMLQQFRHLFDRLVYGEEPDILPVTTPVATGYSLRGETISIPVETKVEKEDLPEEVKSMVIVQVPVEPLFAPKPMPVNYHAPEAGPVPAVSKEQSPSAKPASPLHAVSLAQFWDHEVQAAREQLQPEGAVCGAVKEIQAGLGALLQLCLDQGVKVGPWRLQHVVAEYSFGDHPTYGSLTLGHWVCRDGQPWKVGIGLFLGRNLAKSRDLLVKMSAWDQDPCVIDHLILLRPEDDLILSGKGKQCWQEMEKKGRHSRLEPLALEVCATLYAFPRILANLTEGLPLGEPMPLLATLVQEKCEKLLEQICMPVHYG